MSDPLPSQDQAPQIGGGIERFKDRVVQKTVDSVISEVDMELPEIFVCECGMCESSDVIVDRQTDRESSLPEAEQAAMPAYFIERRIDSAPLLLDESEISSSVVSIGEPVEIADKRDEPVESSPSEMVDGEFTTAQETPDSQEENNDSFSVLSKAKRLLNDFDPFDPQL